MGALVAALYVWAFGFKERAAHFDFMAERQAQTSAVQSQTTKTPDQLPKSVAPEQMPSGLYPAFLQAQQSGPSADYAIAATGNGLEAKNPANGFNSRFTAGGVEFDGWQMRLSGLGWAGQTPALVNETAPVVKDNRVEYHRMGGLTEWYLNGPLGLEQGFTLAQPLAAPPDDGWLSLELSLHGATATPTGQDDWLALNPTNGPALRYGKLYAYDAGGAPLPTKLEVKPGGKGLRLLANLQGARFPVTVDPFIQKQFITDENGNAYESFGTSVALNSTGDIALVGAFAKYWEGTTTQGAVYVFSRSETGWRQQQVLSDTLPNGSTEDFGQAVALNSTGDIALVGAFFKTVGQNSRQGVAYIFSRSGTSWSQQQILSDTTTGATDDYFGGVVALNDSGDVALIGAYNKQIGSNAGQGAAYIFTRNERIWYQQQILSDTISGAVNDNFGYSVALNGTGDEAIIGTPGKQVGSHSFQGVAYVFSRSGTSWSQQQILSDTNGIATDRFGWSVALNKAGDVALIGVPFKVEGINLSQGVTYVYNRAVADWKQSEILSDTVTGAPGDDFGWSVTLNSTGNLALISAAFKKIGMNSGQGAAYLFGRNSAGWSQQQIISDTTNGAQTDIFGQAVTLNKVGDIAFIGAIYKTIGTNIGQGAVYIFGSHSYSSINLGNNPNPSIVNQQVTFTATVSPISATGTVTFTEGAAILGTGTLSSGVATFATAGLPVGSHAITSIYGGDSNYTGSTSTTITQVVGCNPNDALVTNINDDGTGGVCGSFSYALVHASPGVTITFALTQSNTITFTGSLTATVPMSVTVDGGSGAGIVLDGHGVAGDGLRLAGGDTLINLTIKHFGGRELVAEGPGNRLRGVRISQT
jgi:hypothetical protein